MPTSLRAFRRPWVAGLGFALCVTTMIPHGAGALPGEVIDLYDPFELRDMTLVMDPLVGWSPPADCDNVPSDPFCPTDWSNMSPEAKSEYLIKSAQTAAWNIVRFDTTNLIELPAVLSIDGGSEVKVFVRRKSSRALPSESDPRKVGLKISLPSSNPYGVTKLSLENGGDVSPIAEGLAWALHQRSVATGTLYPEGHDPALAAWANVSVNGENLGVYTSVEQRNKRFLENRGWRVVDPTWLYEGDDIGFPVAEQGPKTADGSIIPSPTFGALCFEPFVPANTQCPVPSDYELSTLLPALIDMNAMLTQAAVDAFTANNDALVSKGKNYHAVDRSGEKRRYYPWDLDAVFRGSPSDSSNNIYSNGSSTNKRSVSYSQSPYQRIILNHPTFRAQFNAIMISLLDGPLASNSLHAFLDAIVDTEMTDAIAADPYVSAVIGNSLDEHISSLKSWISQRESAIRQQVQTNLPTPRPNFEVPRTATMLGLNLPISARVGSTVVLTAVLTSSDGPVPSADVSMTFNKVTYRALTNSSGLVTWTLKLPTKAGSYAVSAAFAGDVRYQPSTTSSTLNVTK